MNIQAEKIRLIRQIADIDSELVLKKIKSILKTAVKDDTVKKNASNPVMAKRLHESREQIKKGKGVKVTLDEIWK